METRFTAGVYALCKMTVHSWVLVLEDYGLGVGLQGVLSASQHPQL